MTRFIGLDVHKKKVSVTILNSDDSRVQYDFPLSEEGLQAFEAELLPMDEIALEATTNAYVIYDRICPRVQEVKIANTRKVRLISQNPAKCDRNDSGDLAKLLKLGYLPTIWVPDKATREDREILHHRMMLVKDHRRIQQRIRSFLFRHGILVPHARLKGQDSREFLICLSAKLRPVGQEKLLSLLRQLDMLKAEIVSMDQSIELRAENRPEVEILRTTTGVDTLIALTILAVIGDIKRFPKPESLVNYAGLVPRTRSSGDRCRQGSITKAGSHTLRWALTEAVHHLVRRPGNIQNLYQRLRRRHKHKGVAVTACARKLLECVWHMLQKKEPFRDMDTALIQRKEKRRQTRLEAARAGQKTKDLSPRAFFGHLSVLIDLAGTSDSDVLLPLPPELKAFCKRNIRMPLSATFPASKA